MRNTSLLLIFILFLSCKRETFDDKYNEIFGHWKWTYSKENSGPITTFSASSIGNYSIELTSKCIVCKKDGKKEFKRRFKSISKAFMNNSSDSSSYGFFVTTSKNEDIIITYIPNKVMLKVSGYPYTYIESKKFDSNGEYDMYYTNFYVRE